MVMVLLLLIFHNKQHKGEKKNTNEIKHTS